MRLAPLLLSACAVYEPAPTGSDAPTDTDVDSTDIPSDKYDDSVIECFGGTTSVSLEGTTWTLRSSAALRDGPSSGELQVTERAGDPRLRSGVPALDAIFALTLDEVHQASVDAVSDGAFAGGAPQPCTCFQTGALWPWAWTRDSSYAADLGLAWVDPQRARDTLLFALSAPGDGGPRQVVQDTGSGGAWPVSTDRVAWAFGARRVLAHLDDADRATFAADVHEALAATLAMDEAVRDPADGLYRGEQSFLDWREQSRPSWMADDVAPIAGSKALSTNAAHHAALTLLASVEPDPAAAAGYAEAASALAQAMQAFWIADRGAYGTVLGDPFDPSVHPHTDVLGTALTVLEGVAPADRASMAVAATPHEAAGPPVIWPSLPGVPIYHDRAAWPFVTAYDLRAARATGHEAAVAADVEALVCGVASQLSNMEALEASTGAASYDDGDLSGPKVNSRRQLWSVAAGLAVVFEGLFGLEADEGGLAFRPLLPGSLRQGLLADSEALVLEGVVFRGARFDLTLPLPEGTAPAWVLDRVLVDGVDRGAEPIPAADLDGAQVQVQLRPRTSAGPALTRVDVATRLVAPVEPTITSLDGPIVGLAGPSGTRLQVHRNGVLVEADGHPGPWIDPDGDACAETTCCYTLTAFDPATGHTSQPSAPRCAWDDRLQVLDAWTFTQTDQGWSTDHGREHVPGWGGPDQTLEIAAFRSRWTGEARVQLEYGNGSGPVSTGITAGVFQVAIEDLETGALAGEGLVALPQLGSWDRWATSTTAPVTLEAGRDYRLRLSYHPNMSAFDHFDTYDGAGGGPGVWNLANLAAVKLLLFEGSSAPAPTPTVVFDGTDDVQDLPEDQRLVPGVPLEAWDAFGLEWDDAFLHLAVVSPAFEDPYRPFVLYLETPSDPSDPAVPGEGMVYDGLVPALPFTPALAIVLRPEVDTGGDGPFPGVWRRDPAGWVRIWGAKPGEGQWLAGDAHTLAARIPRWILGDPRFLRAAGHVVNAVDGSEWKDAVPADHAPWSGEGGWLAIDLDGDHTASAW